MKQQVHILPFAHNHYLNDIIAIPLIEGMGYGSSWLAVSVQKSMAAQRKSHEPHTELVQYLESLPALNETNAIAQWGVSFYFYLQMVPFCKLSFSFLFSAAFN